MQQTVQFKQGDRVLHDDRPEWGVGLIQRVENVRVGGKPTQRLAIRFSNAGMKTLSSLGASLCRVEEDEESTVDDGQTLVAREQSAESGWLGEISKRKPEDAMVELSEEATDRFRPLEKRLRFTLNLYRFDPTGGSLIDWAVARSGLDDPLSRFTRHELEQYFDRWAALRQKHLATLLKEARNENGMLERLLSQAPPAARKAVRQVDAS